MGNSKTPNKPSIRRYREQVAKRFFRFRQASTLALAMTALLLLLADLNLQTPSVAEAQETLIENETVQSLDEAQSALKNLLSDFFILLPKIAIAIGLLILAWGIFQLFKVVYSKVQRDRQKHEGVVTLVRLFLIFIGLILALTVLAGDVRALIGSLGLIGLALSWTLQQPIESFSGYLLNTFRAYYRIGDRINVGNVYGDVYRIDFLTTTVWEVGGPGKSVSGAQPTGAMITFPNSEVVRSNIINYSKDFPYIWDEVVIGVSNESDLSYTIQVLREVTKNLIGTTMQETADHYQRLLSRSGLQYDVEELPQVYLTAAPSWTDCTVRYLVELRKRRAWSSLLYEKLSGEITKTEHQGKIIPSYPKSIVISQKPER